MSTQYNLDHFGGGLHSQSLDWYWQTKQYRKIHKLNTTQKASTTLRNTAKQNCPGSVASYDTRPGNEVGLFCSAAINHRITTKNNTRNY